MALYRIVNNNGTLEKESLTGVGGLPLGAIISYYGSSVPDGYLPCDGSTFDETTYPALYMLLGSNTLPVVMDESAKAVTFSNYENVSSTSVITYPFTLKHASKYNLMIVKAQIRAGQGLATQNKIDLTQYTTRDVVYFTWADGSLSNTVGFYVTYDPDTDEAVFDASYSNVPYSVTFFEAIDGYNDYTPTYKAIKAVSGYEASQESTLFNDLKEYPSTWQDITSDFSLSVSGASLDYAYWNPALKKLAIKITLTAALVSGGVLQALFTYSGSNTDIDFTKNITSYGTMIQSSPTGVESALQYTSSTTFYFRTYNRNTSSSIPVGTSYDVSLQFLN